MAVNNWFLQFLADQCRLTVQKPNDIETTAKGAAVLAGIGFGVYNSFSALDSVWELKSELRPIRPTQETERDYKGWILALDRIKDRV
jgi:glycerol kinase